MVDLPKIPQFDKLTWEKTDIDSWHLRDGLDLVGEVYELESGLWKWHCKTSDWREATDNVEQAKLDCVVSHVRGLLLNYADAKVAAMRG